MLSTISNSGDRRYHRATVAKPRVRPAQVWYSSLQAELAKGEITDAQFRAAVNLNQDIDDALAQLMAMYP